MTVTGQDVADFLGLGDDAEFVTQAGTAAVTVTAIARTYTRGQGFTNDEPNDDVAAVILTAACRLAVNPHQNIREQIGDYQVTPSLFQGFTLAEAMVLNTYRRRTA